MSDEAALLAAIRDHPDEDTPRLAYADWLDEHDRPERAEFIRVQVELARLLDDDPRRADLEVRERRLLAKNVVEWAAPWPLFGNWEYAGDGPLRAVFRRGFLEETEGFGIPGSASRDSLAELCAAHPIRHVLATGHTVGNLSALIGRPELQGIDSLSLYVYFNGRETAALRQEQIAQVTSFLRHADLSRLRRLNLMLPGVDENAVVDWLRLPVARQLVTLGAPIGPGVRSRGAWLRGLTGGEFPHLRELTLDTAGRPEYVRELARFVGSDVWARLTGLTVIAGRLPWAEGLNAGRLSRLTAHFASTREFAAFATALESAPPTLEDLNLGGDLVRGENLSRLLAADGAANLRRLTLMHARLTNDDLARLADAPALGHLNRLWLWLDHTAGSDLEALFASPHLGRLTHLRVLGGSVPTAAIRALARNESARRLRVLSLNSLIDPAALAELTSAEAFPDLHTVGFGYWRPPPDAAALEAFLNSPKLPRLCVVPFNIESRQVEPLAGLFRRCGRLAWAGGEMIDGGDGVRVAVVPENVYLPNHLDDLPA